MKRPSGMAQRAFSAWIAACFEAGIDPDRIMQTMGYAPASAGTHKKDGKDEFGNSYCAAVDIRVRGLRREQRQALLKACANHGFIGWERDWKDNVHGHLIYVAIPMKKSLRDQCHDYFNDRDGLVGHHHNTGFQASQAQENALRAAFLAHNPATG